MRIFLQPYQRITEASRTVGISTGKLRRGCKNGTIPHVCIKGTYFVNVAALLEQLDTNQQHDSSGING